MAFIFLFEAYDSVFFFKATKIKMTYYGLTWNALSKATQKHMVTVKVLLGVVLTALAVFLGVAG